MAYSDIDISFNKRITGRLVPQTDIAGLQLIDENGLPVKKELYDVRALSETAAIVRALKNIVLTLPGEKKFDFDYGTDIFRSLFENAPLGNETLFILAKIKEKIQQYEPRVKVLNVTVDYSVDQYTLNIVISVTIIKSQINVNIPLILKRTR
jgi:phage baseplate assembly protein W